MLVVRQSRSMIHTMMAAGLYVVENLWVEACWLAIATVAQTYDRHTTTSIMSDWNDTLPCATCSIWTSPIAGLSLCATRDWGLGMHGSCERSSGE